MAFQDIGIRVTIQGMSQFQRDISAIDRGLNSVKTSFSKATGAGSSFGQALTNMGNKISSIGDSLTRSITLPLIAVTTGLVTAGIAFEDAFSGVGKTVDGVMDNMGNLTEFGEELRQEFRKLALEIPISVNELSRVGQMAGQLGVAKEEILEFTRIAALLGVTTDFSAENAAVSFARLGNIVGVESKDMVDFITRAGNATVQLGNNFATTEPEILALALRFAGTGKAVGLLTPQILGIATALSSMGVRAELGGSAVTKILLEMQSAVNSFDKTTNSGSEQLEAFADVMGLTQEVVRNMFNEDADQAFLRLLSHLNTLSEEGVLTAGILKTLGLDTIRLKEILNKVGPNIDLVTDAMGAANKEWGAQDALINEANKKFATTASKLKILKNGLIDLGITLFDIVQPALNAIIGTLTTFIIDLSSRLKIDEGFQSTLLKIIVGLIALGPALKGVGLALRIIAPLFSTFTFIFANPLLLGAVAALVVGFIALKDVLGPLARILIGAFQGAFGGADAGLQMIEDFTFLIEIGLGSVAQLFNQLGLSMRALFDNFEQYSNITESLQRAFDSLLTGDFEGFIHNIKLAFNEFIFWFQNFGWPLIKEEWLKIRPLLTNVLSDAFGGMWRWITEIGIPGLIGVLGDLITAVWNFIVENTPVLFDKLKEWANAFANWVEESWPTWLKFAEGFITDVFGWIKEKAPLVANKLVEWATAFVEWAKDLWNGGTNSTGAKVHLEDLILSLSEWVGTQAAIFGTKFIDEWIPAFVDWISHIWDGSEGNEGAETNLENFRDDFDRWILLVLIPWTFEASKKIGKAFVRGVIEGIKETRTELWDEIADVLDSIPGASQVRDIYFATGAGAGNAPVPDRAGGMYYNDTRVTGAFLRARGVNTSNLSSLRGVTSALGSTTTNNNLSNITHNNTSNFAPNIAVGPSQQEQDIGNAVYHAYLSSRAVG